MSAAACPNEDWRLATVSGHACVPKSDTIRIDCRSTEMVIHFKSSHLYSDPEIIDQSLATARAGACSSTLTVGDEYSLSIPLDDCGTTVTQGNGMITFTNTIVGDDAALKIDNIIVTEKLELNVQCHYEDSFSLVVDEIGVTGADHDIEGSANDSSVSFSCPAVLGWESWEGK